MTGRTNHLRGALAVIALLRLAPAHAIDSIVLEVREATIAGVPMRGANLRLDLLSDKQARISVKLREAKLPDPAGSLTDIAFVCDKPVVAEPRFGCDAGTLAARGGPTGTLDMQVRAELRSDSGITTFSGKGLKVAGTTAAFDGRMDQRGWQVKGSTGSAKVSALRKFIAPWFALPADITGDGDIQIEGTVADGGAGLNADVVAKLNAVDLTNEASTIVTDKMAASLRLRVSPSGQDTALIVDVSGNAGQVLVNPVLFDFGKNATVLTASGKLHGNLLNIDSMQLRQKDLLDLSGSGSVNLAGEIPSISGNFKLNEVKFPAAFTSYAQITLAASVIGDAVTRGTLSGDLSVVDNGVASLHVKPKELDLSAAKGSLFLNGMNGEIFWAPAGGTDARISNLAWRAGGAYGLSGSPGTELEFAL